ncbi:hypothetical protein [Kitasatospora cinereorecta]|uniref:Uncharacterized protein n=1 Tax=Kitasatospora cinereorecta TaxID=285560 RepID=A0ABW0VDB3_9ACTN
MDLRPELLPPAVDPRRLDALHTEIGRITDLLATGSTDADAAITAFNADTGHAYTVPDFADPCAARSLTDFATEAARPAHPRVPDITRDELAEIIHRIATGDRETDHYLRLLHASIPHPHLADLIFHPPAHLRDAPPHALADAALAYRPIAL